jgi:AraC family transcriptional activator of pobA
LQIHSRQSNGGPSSKFANMKKEKHAPSATAGGANNQQVSNRDMTFARMETLFAANSKSCKQLHFFYYFLVTEGSCDLRLDGYGMKVNHGQLLMLTPRMTLQIKSMSEDFHSCGICLSPDFFDTMPMVSYVYKNLHSLGDATAVLMLTPDESELISKTLKLLEHYLTPIHCANTARTLVFFFLLQISEIPATRHLHLPKSISRSDELFRFFRKEVAQHFRQHRSISFYAAQLHVSPVYLSRVVRKVSGETVNHHVTRHLLVESERLLVLTDLSIKEISEELGFSDQSAFGKFFKRLEGLSPTLYRNRNKQKTPAAHSPKGLAR